MILDLGVLDDARFVDDEGGAFGDATHDEISGREELIVSHAIGIGDMMFVVAEQGDGDAFLFRPCGLGEGIIAGDAEHGGIERLVISKAGRDFAELGGANAGEGHGHKQEHNVGFPDQLAQCHELWPIGGFGDEGEIRGEIANFKVHDGFWGCCGETRSVQQPASICHTNFQNLVATLGAAAELRN
ncbi:MAG: hypothetical protein RLZZ282_339 [Verrucomicrobiota bacterium]